MFAWSVLNLTRQTVNQKGANLIDDEVVLSLEYGHEPLPGRLLLLAGGRVEDLHTALVLLERTVIH